MNHYRNTIITSLSATGKSMEYFVTLDPLSRQLSLQCVLTSVLTSINVLTVQKWFWSMVSINAIRMYFDVISCHF